MQLMDGLQFESRGISLPPGLLALSKLHSCSLRSNASKSNLSWLETIDVQVSCFSCVSPDGVRTPLTGQYSFPWRSGPEALGRQS